MFVRRFLFLTGEYSGSLRLEPAGADIFVSAYLEKYGGNAAWFFLFDEGGRYMPLGAMTPGGGGARLQREFSASEMGQNGVSAENCEGAAAVFLKDEVKILSASKTGCPLEGIARWFEEEKERGAKGSARGSSPPSGGARKGGAPPPGSASRPSEPGGRPRGAEALLPFEEFFGDDFGLEWSPCSVDEVDFTNAAVSAALTGQDIRRAIGAAGGFYVGKINDRKSVICVPARISRDPLPFLHIFRACSFRRSAGDREKGGFFVGIDLSKKIIFPVVFE